MRKRRKNRSELRRKRCKMRRRRKTYLVLQGIWCRRKRRVCPVNTRNMVEEDKEGMPVQYQVYGGGGEIGYARSISGIRWRKKEENDEKVKEDIDIPGIYQGWVLVTMACVNKTLFRYSFNPELLGCRCYDYLLVFLT